MVFLYIYVYVLKGPHMTYKTPFLIRIKEITIIIMTICIWSMINDFRATSSILIILDRLFDKFSTSVRC